MTIERPKKSRIERELFRPSTRTSAKVPTANTENSETKGSQGLFQALYQGDAALFKELLSQGASPLEADIFGLSVLQVAIKEKSAGTDACALHLIESGIDVNVPSVGSQTTALHWACTNPNVKILEALLKAGADPLLRNETGHTPLMIASSECLIDHIKALIPVSNANEVNKSGETALLKALNMTHKSMHIVSCGKQKDITAVYDLLLPHTDACQLDRYQKGIVHALIDQSEVEKLKALLDNNPALLSLDQTDPVKYTLQRNKLYHSIDHLQGQLNAKGRLELIGDFYLKGNLERTMDLMSTELENQTSNFKELALLFPYLTTPTSAAQCKQYHQLLCKMIAARWDEGIGFVLQKVSPEQLAGYREKGHSALSMMILRNYKNVALAEHLVCRESLKARCNDSETPLELASRLNSSLLGLIKSKTEQFELEDLLKSNAPLVGAKNLRL